MQFFDRRFRYRDVSAFFVDCKSAKNASGPKPAFTDRVVEKAMDDFSNILLVPRPKKSDLQFSPSSTGERPRDSLSLPCGKRQG